MDERQREKPGNGFQTSTKDDKSQKSRIRGAERDEEVIEFSIGLSQASSLYIIANDYIPAAKESLKRIQADIKQAKTDQEKDKLLEINNVILSVIEDAEAFKKEAAEVINELDI